MNIRNRIIEQRLVTPDEVAPNPRNWRMHPQAQRDALRGILGQVGIAAPVIAYYSARAGNRLMLIDGHERMTIGVPFPCAILDVDDAEADTLLATFDPITAMATANNEALDALLRDVTTDSPALTQMLAELAEEVGLYADTPTITEDEVPEPPADPITKPGDLWLLGDHRLLCGDSTKAEDVERLMAGARADLCFTSPPYNLGKSVGLRNGARKGSASAYNDNTDTSPEWSDLMRSFLSLALIASDCVACNVQMLAGNKAQLLSLLGEYAKRTVDIAVWIKTNPQPAMAEGVMNSAFEFVWILSGEQNPTRRIATASFDRGTFSNVFESSTASGHDASIHGAVFPVKVAAHYIQGMSHSRSRVYEPFCGSGTTLIAAEQLGRKCYGMEISPAYCDVIVKRWETLTGKKAVRVPLEV